MLEKTKKQKTKQKQSKNKQTLCFSLPKNYRTERTKKFQIEPTLPSIRYGSIFNHNYKTYMHLDVNGLTYMDISFFQNLPCGGI